MTEVIIRNALKQVLKDDDVREQAGMPVYTPEEAEKALQDEINKQSDREVQEDQRGS